jgi:hypothetical protein
MFTKLLMSAIVPTGPELQFRLSTFVDKCLAKVAPVRVEGTSGL